MTMMTAPNREPQGFHYDLIAEALRLIEQSAEGQPSLDALAERMGMSPTHFQKLFSQWVGVSPKRYLQYLTLDHAKRLLAERHTVLDATYATGLSSPGRLHDLFVRWEAMSPGDYAKGGSGLTIRWGWFDGPFGEALAMGTDRGLCGMAFAAEVGRDAAMADMPVALARGDLHRGSRGPAPPGSRPPSGRAARRGSNSSGRRSRSRSGRRCSRCRPATSPPTRRSPRPSDGPRPCAPWAPRWDATRSAG